MKNSKMKVFTSTGSLFISAFVLVSMSVLMPLPISMFMTSARADWDTMGEREIFSSEKRMLLLGFSSANNLKQYDFLSSLVNKHYRDLDYVGIDVSSLMQNKIDAYLKNSEAPLPDFEIKKDLKKRQGIELVLAKIRTINETRESISLKPIRVIALNCNAGCPMGAPGVLENNESMVRYLSALTHGFKDRGIVALNYVDASRNGYDPPLLVQKMFRTQERISSFHSVLKEKVEDPTSVVSVWLQAPDSRLQNFAAVLPEWQPLFKIARKYRGRYVEEIDTRDIKFLEYERKVKALAPNTGLQISSNYDYYIRIPATFSMGNFCSDLMGAPVSILRGSMIRILSLVK